MAFGAECGLFKLVGTKNGTCGHLDTALCVLQVAMAHCLLLTGISACFWSLASRALPDAEGKDSSFAHNHMGLTMLKSLSVLTITLFVDCRDRLRNGPGHGQANHLSC